MANWQSKAFAAVAAAAGTKAGQKAAQEAATKAVAAVAKVGAGGAGKARDVRRVRADREAHRDRAIALARQVHGQLTDSILIGSDHRHWIVWKDGAPLAAFPDVGGDLAGRAELSHVEEADLKDPDDVAAHRQAPRRRLGRRGEVRDQAD
jgi:hypothetical protein